MEVVILNENGDSVGNLEIVDEIFKVKSLGDKKAQEELEQVLLDPQFG